MMLDLLAIPASGEDANGWQRSRTALLRGVTGGPWRGAAARSR
ncbi:hypothetical protein [Saccharopolyspora spinosa]|uniref:Uncharacterized protein n=1 Tax=Saccharopolyspora spinosa TaxID=60894 RepID=A0A2N3XRV6_SACSN|nr:hypothetical protein A8926_0896 [Saccharopolyspora spinosa]